MMESQEKGEVLAYLGKMVRGAKTVTQVLLVSKVLVEKKDRKDNKDLLDLLE